MVQKIWVVVQCASLQNKNILNLCLRSQILRSYHLVAEVTFNDKPAKFKRRLHIWKNNFTYITSHYTLHNLPGPTLLLSKNSQLLFFFIIHTLPDPILLLCKNRKLFLLCLNFLVAQPGDNTRIEFGHQFLCEHHLVIWTLHLGDLGGGTVFYIYPLFCYISIVSSKVFPPTNFKSKLDTDLLFALYYLLTTILYYFHSSPLHSSYWPLF